MHNFYKTTNGALLIAAACVALETHVIARENLTGNAEGKKQAAVKTAPSIHAPLNVKDFGAKGDGVTDDTDAIQRCLLKASIPLYGGAAVPEVFFPKGIYLVSRTLLVPEYAGLGQINLRGEQATIRQTDPTADILYFRLAHRHLIEGLTFEGGKRQIKLWSNNLDSTHIIIRDCTFRKSSGCAIDDQLRKDTTSSNWYAIMEPYRTSKNEQGLPVLAPVDETQAPMFGYVSTCMRITRCSFQQCMQVISVWADWTLMDDCSIETHPDMSGPAILAGGALLMENVQGLAHATPGKNQWWITVDPRKQPYGVVGLDLKNVRLKTDAKDGWCVIRNETKFTGGNHVYIIADGCEFQSAGARENCLLDLVEAPNLINIRNCRETSGRKVNILGIEKPFEEDYFHFHSPEVFAYVINENNRGLVPNLPESMKPFSDAPLPEKIARRFDQEPTTVTLPRMREGIDRQVNLLDFGSCRDGNADDSEAFQKAFAAARQAAGLVEVIIPNGVYRMDKTVALPPRVVARGSGRVAFIVPAGKKGAIFTVVDAERLVLQNLDFYNCEQALAITTKRDFKSNILIDNCCFRENRDFAVTCLSGTGEIAEPNQTTLRISDCTFIRSRALLHNTKYALMDNAWITTDAAMINSGVIVNKGTFHLKSLCGVPQTTLENKSGGKDRIDTKANDLRWIDNYYQVLCDRCRFGGEDSGLPMVVNFASRGQVLLQNNWLCHHGGNPKRVTIVDCAELPEMIAFRGNWGWPSVTPMMLTIRTGAKGALKGRFFESGNTAPALIKDERNTPPAPR